MAFPEDTYWAVVEMVNLDTGTSKYYLEIDYPQLDVIELFESKNDEVIQLFTSGDQLPFEQRPVLSRSFAFPLTLQSQDTITVLIKLQKFKSAMRFPMSLHSEQAYNAAHFKSNLLHSIYFGIILLVALTSLSLGLIVGKNTFAIYALYVLVFGFWLFTRLGYSYQFIIPNSPELNQHLLPVCGQLAVMGLILYVRSFFNTREYLPIFHKVMTGVLVFFLLGYVAWAAFPDEFVLYATRLFILRYVLFTTTVVFAFTACIAYRKVEKFRSNMFLLAYSLFLMAILSKIIAEYGLVNEYNMVYDPIMVGFLIEVLVLSSAMGVILKRYISQTQKVKSENDQLQENLDRYEKQSEITQNGYVILTSKASLITMEIIYIQSDDHYLEFNLTSGKKEIDRNSLSKALESLPDYFVQTHRSFIVNLNQVRAAYSEKLVMYNGIEIKLSRKYKQDVHSRLKNTQDT